MSMTTEAGLVLGAMVVVYALARAARLSTELAMVAAALGGAVAGGFWFPARHVAEGAATYLDINLIFITATLFMNLLKASGGVAFVVRGILRQFHRQHLEVRHYHPHLAEKHHPQLLTLQHHNLWMLQLTLMLKKLEKRKIQQKNLKLQTL